MYYRGVYYTAAIFSPSEVRVGWNCLVAGSGRREVSSHTPTAVPAAMAAPRTVISQKVRANCVYMWGGCDRGRGTRERIGKEGQGKGKRDERKDRERRTRERKERREKG